MPDRAAGEVDPAFAQSSDPRPTVYEYAQQHGFDLLILGWHGVGRVLPPASALAEYRPRLMNALGASMPPTPAVDQVPRPRQPDIKLTTTAEGLAVERG